MQTNPGNRDSSFFWQLHLFSFGCSFLYFPRLCWLVSFFSKDSVPEKRRMPYSQIITLEFLWSTMKHAAAYRNGSKWCNLFLEEKPMILKGGNTKLWNKRTELIQNAAIQAISIYTTYTGKTRHNQVHFKDHDDTNIGLAWNSE